jgi:hypothetical protein
LITLQETAEPSRYRHLTFSGQPCLVNLHVLIIAAKLEDTDLALSKLSRMPPSVLLQLEYPDRDLDATGDTHQIVFLTFLSCGIFPKLRHFRVVQSQQASSDCKLLSRVLAAHPHIQRVHLAGHVVLSPILPAIMPFIHTNCLSLKLSPEDVAFVDMIKPEVRLLVTGVESTNASGLWPVLDALEAAAARRGTQPRFFQIAIESYAGGPIQWSESASGQEKAD